MSVQNKKHILLYQENVKISSRLTYLGENEARLWVRDKDFAATVGFNEKTLGYIWSIVGNETE